MGKWKCENGLYKSQNVSKAHISKDDGVIFTGSNQTFDIKKNIYNLFLLLLHYTALIGL